MSAPAVSILDACADPALFQRWFRNPETWRSWFVFLRALFGLPMADAEDELSAAMAAHARLLARQGELDADIVRARNDLVAAADAVLIAERAAQALEQAEEALAQLLAARRVLQAVCAKPRLEGSWRDSQAEAMRTQAWAAADLGDDGADVRRHFRSDVSAEDWQRHPDAAAWHEARAALLADADAALPE